MSLYSAYETLSADELLALVQERDSADPEHDSDELWSAIGALARRADDAVVKAVEGWCCSDRPPLRRLGADVFGQMGCYEALPIDRVPALNRLRSLLHDPEASVRSSAAASFGHFPSDLWSPSDVIPFAEDSAEEVRFSVAFALGGTCCDRSDAAVQALLRLMEDPDDDVRDWATFGLGISDADSPLVRDALAKRLDDPRLDTRCEAIVGLARRHDERAASPILEGLGYDSVSSLMVEAAEAMPRRAFLEPLQAILESNPDDPSIEAAIAACQNA